MLRSGMEKGLIFESFETIGKMIGDISFGNAVNYFGVKTLLE